MLELALIYSLQNFCSSFIFQFLFCQQNKCLCYFNHKQEPDLDLSGVHSLLLMHTIFFAQSLKGRPPGLPSSPLIETLFYNFPNLS